MRAWHLLLRACALNFSPLNVQTAKQLGKDVKMCSVLVSSLVFILFSRRGREVAKMSNATDRMHGL
jgi:hypothetical protein